MDLSCPGLQQLSGCPRKTGKPQPPRSHLPSVRNLRVAVVAQSEHVLAPRSQGSISLNPPSASAEVNALGIGNRDGEGPTICCFLLPWLCKAIPCPPVVGRLPACCPQSLHAAPRACTLVSPSLACCLRVTHFNSNQN